MGCYSLGLSYWECPGSQSHFSYIANKREHSLQTHRARNDQFLRWNETFFSRGKNRILASTTEFRQKAIRIFEILIATAIHVLRSFIPSRRDERLLSSREICSVSGHLGPCVITVEVYRRKGYAQIHKWPISYLLVVRAACRLFLGREIFSFMPFADFCLGDSCKSKP